MHRNRNRNRFVSCIMGAMLAGASAGAPCALAAVPFTLGGPGVHPNAFRVTEFATGLTVPVGMVQLADGSIVYGAAKPTTVAFQTGTFELRRLVDSNGDGVADNGIGDLLYTGPADAGGINALATSGDLVFALSNTVNRFSNITARITVLRPGATPGDDLTEVGALNMAFEDGAWHMSHGMAVRDIGGGQHEVYFNIGSDSNSAQTATIEPTASGLVSGTMDEDSIFRFTVNDPGSGNVTGSGLTQIATGLRNAAGLAFNPADGALWFQDNGEDAGGNDPLGADELNRLTPAQLDGAIEDFGFDTDYIVYGGPGAPAGTTTGDRVQDTGRNAVQPEVAFVPYLGEHNQGASQIAFAPDRFPASLRDGIFTGFHGYFVSGGTSNPENPLTFFDLDAADTADVTDGFFHVIEPGLDGVGHLDGLLATSDSLFVADMTKSGHFLSNPAPTDGVIYQILALNAPDGDANFDGTVNALDLSILASNWLTSVGGGSADGDFNIDGTVNALDLSILANNWLTSVSGDGVSFSDAAGTNDLGSIPEPSSLLLLGAASLLLIKRPSSPERQA